MRSVTIGSNDHGGALGRPLSYAEDDAREFHRGLLTQRVHDRSDCELFTDPRQVEDVRQAIKAKSAAAGPGDLFLVYFAGHGLVEDEAGGGDGLFLSCAGASAADPLSGSLRLAEVVKACEASAAASAVVVLDCCFSGHPQGRSVLGPRYLRRLQTGRPLRRRSLPPPRGTGRIVLAACGENQYAHESSYLGHGVLTWALLKALRSAAPAGSVSVARLYATLQESLLRKTNGQQCPLLYGGDHGSSLPAFFA
ncbi:caspase domain-containing protein [Streptomyces sp. NPDC096094]|uniref:caspase family protein n=1 Tax=Streptomyces sp. NPDC096094 TaxID=3366073 RepID=UPI003828E0A4